MTLAQICSDLEIEIVPVQKHPGPGQTTAASTLQEILDRRGAGHLAQVVRTITETENRTRARIDAFALYAISDIMVAHPQWADSGLRWYEIFDTIDLGAIQRQAKANRGAVQQRHGVATLLYRELADVFAIDFPPPKTHAQRREEREAAKAAIAKRRTDAIEAKVELGRQLAALRDATPNNKRFGNLVRKQFDIHDSLFVGEVQRVARRYGDRPDVTGRVRNWHVLVALASPYLQESGRREFEAKIAAGEKVTAKSIAAAAGPRKNSRPSNIATIRAAGQ
ncbi:hypothetical protein [Bradyrhizobium sp. USDA 10063]